MDPIPSPDNPAAASSAYRPDIPREAMRAASFIVRRMAADMREIEAEWGSVEPWHLHQRGWSPHQVRAYGKSASEEASRLAKLDPERMKSATGEQPIRIRPAKGGTFTRTERALAAFSIIGAFALMLAGIVEIARPGTLPAFNAAAVQPAPQAVAFPVCRAEGA